MIKLKFIPAIARPNIYQKHLNEIKIESELLYSKSTAYQQEQIMHSQNNYTYKPEASSHFKPNQTKRQFFLLYLKTFDKRQLSWCTFFLMTHKKRNDRFLNNGQTQSRNHNEVSKVTKYKPLRKSIKRMFLFPSENTTFHIHVFTLGRFHTVQKDNHKMQIRVGHLNEWKNAAPHILFD